MFDKEYTFRGSHGEKVNRLTAAFDKQNNKLFDTNYRVYMLAPIVGFLYSVTAEQQKSDENDTKIFAGQFNNIRDDLMFNYRLIMLLDKKHEPDFEKRVDKAFRYYGSEKAKDDEARYEAFVRGGVDKLYEKIMEGAQSPEDYLVNLYNFMDEIDERYNRAIDKESILDLCRLAKN